MARPELIAMFLLVAAVPETAAATLPAAAPGLQVCGAGSLDDGDPLSPEPASAAAPAEPRVIFLWYADGGQAPNPGVCTGMPPAFTCSYGGDGGVEECKRKVQAYLDRWYLDFNVVFTVRKPETGAYDTVVITSSGASWCGRSLPAGAGGVAPASCADLGGNVCYSFACGESAKSCATIIAQEQAHLVGLMHTNSAADLLYPAVCTACDGFEDKENPVYGGQCRATQNSYQMMKERLGAWPAGTPKPDPFTCSDQAAPAVTILEPADGAEIGSEIQVRATASDDCAVTRATIDVAGASATSPGAGPFAWMLGDLAGPLAIRVTVFDDAGRSATAVVNVTAPGEGGVPPPPGPGGNTGGCSTPGGAPTGAASLALSGAILALCCRRRPRRVPAPPLTLALGALLAACGSDATPGAEAGVDAAADRGPEITSILDAGDAPAADAPVVDAAPEAAPPVDTCSVVQQDCPSPQICALTCPGGAASCIADPGGTGIQREPCSMTMPCAKGHVCAVMMAGGAGVCLKFCNTTADCTTGGACTPAMTGANCGSRPITICY